MRFKYILVLLITFFGFQDTFSQGKSIDSLMNLSYDDLDKIYYETESITDKENITRSYIDKAIASGDSIYMARGYYYYYYYYYAILYDAKTNIKYADTIIQLTENKKHLYY